MTTVITAELERIRVLARGYEIGPLAESVARLTGTITADSPPVDPAQLLDTLQVLRNSRAFDCIEQLCNRLMKFGQGTPTVRRFYAQALIDRDRIMSAIDVLNSILAELSDPDHTEYKEAHGLLGRCYKQLYVDIVRAGGDNDERRRAAAVKAVSHFNKALDHYGMVIDKANLARTDWHTINVIALMARAESDGLANYQNLITQWADHVIKAVMPRGDGGDDPWAMATLGEAYAALGRWDEARQWLVRFAEHAKVDAFMLYGTIRQLEELWLLKAGTDSKDRVVTLLKGRLAAISRGTVTFTRGERQSIEALEGLSAGELEARLGKEGPLRVKWLKQGFSAARSIARVRDRGAESEDGFGTGFLVLGRDLAPHLGDERFLLTNAHVISKTGGGHSRLAQHASVTFDEITGQKPVHCREVAWMSPMSELDASLVRLDQSADDLPTISLEDFGTFPDDIEALSKPQRKAIIIGHPEGKELSVSLDDAEIVDLGRRRSDDPSLFLHYKTPTEPGNSGSPVFNGHWQVIAIHHAGPPTPVNGRKTGFRRLSGRDGHNWANEGVVLRSIAERIRSELGG
jgi:tetratricopeptide (TPR) repeat protein